MPVDTKALSREPHDRVKSWWSRRSRTYSEGKDVSSKTKEVAIEMECVPEESGGETAGVPLLVSYAGMTDDKDTHMEEKEVYVAYCIFDYDSFCYLYSWWTRRRARTS